MVVKDSREEPNACVRAFCYSLEVIQRSSLVLAPQEQKPQPRTESQVANERQRLEAQLRQQRLQQELEQKKREELASEQGGGSRGQGLGGGRQNSPGRVTRIVGDLMVFVEVTGEEGPLGLVFKPNKIVDYRGETLQELGVVLNA